MPTIDATVIASRLTTERLTSYLAASGGDVARAIDLYNWNSEASGALYEDVGRLEVVLRNGLDKALQQLASDRGWSTAWYRRTRLFKGKHGQRMQDQIAVARSRATRHISREVHGKVIAELNLGFWRYLCLGTYLTVLWVPALCSVFPGHPAGNDARQVRRSIEDRVQRLHFLRNRIAHHEPIHRRDLRRDHASVVEVAKWICPHTEAWIQDCSRTLAVLARRPQDEARPDAT